MSGWSCYRKLLKGVLLPRWDSNVLSLFISGRYLHHTVRPCGPNDGKQGANLIYIPNKQQISWLPAKAWHRVNTSTPFHLIVWKGRIIRLMDACEEDKGMQKAKRAKESQVSFHIIGRWASYRKPAYIGVLLPHRSGFERCYMALFIASCICITPFGPFILSTGCDGLEWYIC